MDNCICHGCIGDIFVKQRIKNEGLSHRCSYCNSRKKAVDFSTLTKWIDPVYRDNFVPGEEYSTSYEDGESGTTGESPVDIVSEMLGVDWDIASDIVDFLSENESYNVIREGQPALYDRTSTYDETHVSSHQHRELWDEFCYKVKHQSRFYNIETTRILDGLLSKIGTLKYIGEHPPIRKIGPGTYETVVYRARYAKNDDEIIKMKFEPHKELGPPPKSKATPGRMNPQGIPVFYGAMDFETCISEIRLPVGGNAVLAKFEILKPLVVLDLTVFSKMYDTLSYFDPEFETKVSRLKFLREFDQRISEPILSNENVFDYVPTQAFAEYLANHYEVKIDAVIYSSTQAKGESHNNIVILPHEASVEWPAGDQIIDSPKRYRLIRHDDYCSIIDTQTSGVWFVEPEPGFIPNNYNISSSPTLRITKEGISVVKAKSISYEIMKYDIHHFQDKDKST